MLLTIDIGNTNIVLGIFSDGELIESWRFHSLETRTINESWVSVKLLADDAHIDLRSLEGVVLGSVVPKLTFVFRKMCEHYLKLTPLEINGLLDLGIKMLVDNPQEVGADRIANVYACQKLYGRPALVVDFGTATTFDVIDSGGNFIGGAIAPGIETSANYLFEKAALLHRIDFTIPSSAIGRNTQTNLTSGILFGAADQVDGMVARILTETGWKDIPVVVTGGLGKVVASIAGTITHFDADLTLKGLYHIYRDRKI